MKQVQNVQYEKHIPSRRQLLSSGLAAVAVTPWMVNSSRADTHLILPEYSQMVFAFQNGVENRPVIAGLGAFKLADVGEPLVNEWMRRRDTNLNSVDLKNGWNDSITEILMDSIRINSDASGGDIHSVSSGDLSEASSQVYDSVASYLNDLQSHHIFYPAQTNPLILFMRLVDVATTYIFIPVIQGFSFQFGTNLVNEYYESWVNLVNELYDFIQSYIQQGLR